MSASRTFSPASAMAAFAGRGFPGGADGVGIEAARGKRFALRMALPAAALLIAPDLRGNGAGFRLPPPDKP